MQKGKTMRRDVFVICLIIGLFIGAHTFGSAPAEPKQEEMNVLRIAEDSVIRVKLGALVRDVKLPEGSKVIVIFDGEDEEENAGSVG